MPSPKRSLARALTTQAVAKLADTASEEHPKKSSRMSSVTALIQAEGTLLRSFLTLCQRQERFRAVFPPREDHALPREELRRRPSALQPCFVKSQLHGAAVGSAIG